MDVSSSQQNILDDYLLLTNRIILHIYSDYCLVPPKSKCEATSEKVCRMEFGNLSAPGKVLRSDPALVDSVTPSDVSRSYSPALYALQYIALYYNVALAAIHAAKRRPAGRRGVPVATLKHVPLD